MVRKTQPTAGCLESPDHLTMGNRGVPGMHVEVGGVLQPDGSRRDHEVPEGDLRLQCARGSDADEGRVVGDLHDLGQHDLDVVRSHPGGHHREWHAAKCPGRRGDLAIAALEAHLVETRSHLRNPIGIPDQEHVLGELAALEGDVVLP